MFYLSETENRTGKLKLDQVLLQFYLWFCLLIFGTFFMSVCLKKADTNQKMRNFSNFFLQISDSLQSFVSIANF